MQMSLLMLGAWLALSVAAAGAWVAIANCRRVLLPAAATDLLVASVIAIASLQLAVVVTCKAFRWL